MEMVLLLSTIINFITLLALVIVIASYLSMKLKERKQTFGQEKHNSELVTQSGKMPVPINMVSSPQVPLHVSVALSQSNNQNSGNNTKSQYFFQSEKSIPQTKENGSWRLGLRSTL